MKRLVQTTRGWVELELRHGGVFGGFNTSAVVFAEDGWASQEKTWWEKWPNDKSLEAFLSELAGIPVDEAKQIARGSIDAWREAGEEIKERKQARTAYGLMVSIFAPAALGWLALLAVIIAILVIRLT